MCTVIVIGNTTRSNRRLLGPIKLNRGGESGYNLEKYRSCLFISNLRLRHSTPSYRRSLCTYCIYRGARVVLTECARGHLPNMIEPTSSNAYTRATFWELIWQLPQCRNQCEIDIRQQTLRINHGDISE